MGDFSSPLYKTGVFPMDLIGLEPAIRNIISDQIRGKDADLGIFIQPVFGAYMAAGAFGRVYGPLYSGMAYTSAESPVWRGPRGKIRTTLCAGFVADGSNPMVEEGDPRAIREIVRRQARLIQGSPPILTTLTFESQNSLSGKGLDWFFKMLGRLQEFIKEPQVLEWAVVEELGKPKPVILRMADAKSG